MLATPPGYNGAGINVGVLSDSYNNLGGAAADVASGDLPAAGVNVLEDNSSGGTDEGRAMCQLIHHVAPGASISFATAEGGTQTSPRTFSIWPTRHRATARSSSTTSPMSTSPFFRTASLPKPSTTW